MIVDVVPAGRPSPVSGRPLLAARCWSCGWTGPGRTRSSFGRRMLAADVADHRCADTNPPGPGRPA